MTTEAEARYPEAAVELELFLMNDYATYKAYYLPACRALHERVKQDRYTLEHGIGVMRRVVNSAARSYQEKHGSFWQAWYQRFPVGDRDRVAAYCLEKFRSSLRLGDLFWLE